jgi:hypothetical protein
VDLDDIDMEGRVWPASCAQTSMTTSVQFLAVGLLATLDSSAFLDQRERSKKAPCDVRHASPLGPIAERFGEEQSDRLAPLGSAFRILGTRAQNGTLRDAS